MFPFLESSKEAIEKSVHSTGVPLSERFKQVPSHNPLRPSQVVRRILPDFSAARTFGAGIGMNPMHREQLPGIGSGELASHTFGAGIGMNLMHREQRPGIGSGANELAVVKATKDAEILRLRAQVQSMERQLGSTGNDHGRGNPLKTIIGKVPMKNRVGNVIIKQRQGGGVVVAPEGGKHLNLQSTSALSFLGIDKVRRNPQSPLKGPDRSRSGRNRNLFGSSKTKSDLDKELDRYMSQVKSKDQSDLDKELDEYMSVARSKSFTGKTTILSFKPTTPPPDDGEPDSDGMEIVE